MVEIPDRARELLAQPLIVNLATTRPDGAPQVNPMWFIWDGDAKTLRTSDCGYGCTGVALCDGLVESGATRSRGDHDVVLAWEEKGEL